MNFDYLLLPLGLLCLGIPSPVMCSARVREKLRQPSRRRENTCGAMLTNPINWVDLVRGAGGAWLVQHVLQIAHNGQDDLARTFMVAQLAVLFLGVVAQTVWFDRTPRIIGPVFFLVGFTLAVSGPLTGGFAVMLGFACALMLRSLRLAFRFVPVAILGFAGLFHTAGLFTIFNAAMFGLPFFLSFASGTRLAFARTPQPARNLGYRPVSVEFPEGAKTQEAVVIRPDFTPSRVNIGG
jgi:hypothetical protein